MSDFTPQIIEQNRGPTIAFDGRLLGEMSTRKPGADYWRENALWETPSGKWVLEVRKCTEKAGQEDFADVWIFDQADELDRKIAVLDALEWRFPIQRWLKEEMGWGELIRRVE